MYINVIHGDITTQQVDAIVNAANSALSGGGGVDGAIHQAAGPELLKACQSIVANSGVCPTGEAVVTKGFELPAKYVIHTVGPVWEGGDHLEPNKLASCYWKSLDIAAIKRLKSIAFPNISTGIYDFPKELAAKIAIYTTQEWIQAEPSTTLSEIRFVCFDDENYQLYDRLLENDAPLS